MVNIEEIKERLIDKLRPSGWASVLRGFIVSSEFDLIIKDLEKQVDDGKRFTPQLKNVFTAFEECPWEELKCVIVGQDPYPQIGVADGIAFSCSFTGKEQPSLTYFLNSIDNTVYNGIPEPHTTDLRYLSNQGVLLLNSSLTTQMDKPLTHQKIWSAFIAYVLDTISSKKPEVPWAFLGKTAQELESLVNNRSPKYMASHPASAAYNKASEWDCNNIFNNMNVDIKDTGKTEIKW